MEVFRIFTVAVKFCRYLHPLILLFTGFVGASAHARAEISNANQPLVSLSGRTMGTSYHIKFYGLRPVLFQENIDDLLDNINAQMSTYMASSILSKFNESTEEDTWFPVSSEMVLVMQAAKRVHTVTRRAFEPTIGPLVNLWGFGPNKQPTRVPDSEVLARALTLVNFDLVSFREHPPALKKKKSKIYLDLSAIAKGYAVDEVAKYLEQLGIMSYMVEIGGEVRLGQAKPNPSEGLPSGEAQRQRWAIGVEAPDPSIFRNEAKVSRVLKLESISMATSGDYRNYFEKAGERYSHIIDPRTGKPIKHKLASVTVLSETCAEADALATAFMVLGPSESMAIADRHRIAALFITRERTGFVSQASRAMQKVIDSF